MASSSHQHLWANRGTTNGRVHVESPPTIGMNILNMNDLGRLSIENNERVDEEKVNNRIVLPRQKSLNTIEKELLSLNNQIRDKLDAVEKAKKQAEKQAKRNRLYNDDLNTPNWPNDLSGQKANNAVDTGIYATYVQDGDNNLMVVCEPTTSMRRKYCKQIGNNNVMVNVSMVNNKCQIIDLEGQVFQMDSEGAYWLEIRKRHRDSILSTDSVSSSSSDTSTDSNPPELPVFPASPCPPSAERYNMRFPGENLYSDFDDLNISNRSPLATAAPYTVPRWPCENSSRTPQEHYDSSETTHINDTAFVEDDNQQYLDISEEDDVIKIKIEPTPGGQKFSGCQSFEECLPVRTALGHRKVREFLQRPEEKFEVDVSIIGWEYENEQIYSTIPCENLSVDDDNNPYSSPIQLVRKPTLPPRSRDLQTANGIDTGAKDIGNYDSINDMQVTGKNINTPPALPPRLYNEPCEQSYYSTTASSTTSGNCSDCHNEASLKPGSDDKAPKSPRPQKKIVLPPPPIRKPVASPRMPRKRTEERKGNLNDASWYHGQIRSEEAKTVLKGKPDGSFLVRDTKGEHKFTLEVVEAGNPRRLKIWQTNNNYHLEKPTDCASNKEFTSVVELIEAAMKSGIEVQDSQAKDNRTWKIVKIIPVDKT